MSRPPHRQEEEVRLMPIPPRNHRKSNFMRHRSGNDPRRRRRRIVTTSAAIIAVVAIALGVIIYNKSSEPTGPLPVHLPPASASYLGVYAEGVPASYSEVTAFTNATEAKPDVVMYYSGWFVPFPVAFA